MSRLLLLGRREGAVEAALLEDAVLQDFLRAPEDGALEPGAIHLARVARVHQALGLVFLSLEGGGTATLEAGAAPPAEGELAIVQLAAAAHGDKPARARRAVALVGRDVVLRPGGGGTRLPRDAAGDRRLDAIASAAADAAGEGFALALRSAARGAAAGAPAREAASLAAAWRVVAARAAQVSQPALLHAEDAARRAALPLLRARPDAVVAEGRRERDALAGLGVEASLEAPPGGLLAAHGVEEQLALAASPRVAIPGGGTLWVEETRALVAVDVDSGEGGRDGLGARAA
ncbi:MAG: ribonuclease E/G, partial [Alphaproteobacteria bacterium]